MKTGNSAVLAAIDNMNRNADSNADIHGSTYSACKSQEEVLIGIPELFARQCRQTSKNTALVFEDREYSYRELDDFSDVFKQAVLGAIEHDSSDKTDICVGICIDKSPEAIAAMLGILKAGAAFVPLDPDYPPDRIAYMVEDACINTIIAQPQHQQHLQPLLNKSHIQWINCYQPVIDNTLYINRAVSIKPSDLAYIMYTSGSTGKPKGVQIEHGALATYCFADRDVYQLTESDRTLQFSTINFDIAIEEIFPPLLSGGCVVIRPSKRSDHLNELSAIINDYRVSAVHIATAYWHEWVDLMAAADDDIPNSLRLMVVTGEKVSTRHYRLWKQFCDKAGMDVLWCNAYGPTEATVSASVFIPDEEFNEDNMPIGMPLKRYTAMIVDEKLNELGIGETGQLLIGGPALARGYLNRPQLNAEVFVNIEKDGVTQRMYTTGDLARWRADGNIEFAGRIDHQIKLGSYRVEPGEIEVAINHYPDVLESLVSYDEVEGKKSLIAYIAHGDSQMELMRLTDFLKENLPAYMVPARFVLLKSFPKTTNGKIDRKALPDPSESLVACASGHVAPRNQLEQKLAGMWREVLRLPHVGVHDDFFALGGSSLLAVGVVSRLVSDLDLELPVRDFFANPTIASQARHIQKMLEANGNDAFSGDPAESDTTDDADRRALRDRLPQVKPAFFSNGEHRLYGVHYQPPRISAHASRAHAVLMCHPLGHEYPRSYRNLQQLAIQLAQAGFDVFRFDYFATGNSEGSSEQLTAEQCAKDIRIAADYIREQSACGQLSLLGVRLGAPFMMMAGVENVENMIALDPVISGANYINMLERFHQRELRGLNGFRMVRNRSSVDQLLGHAFSEQKRNSLNDLDMLEIVSALSDRPVDKLLLTSADYLAHEAGCEQLLQDWRHHSCDDEIYWHDPLYVNSAFSSPQIFKAVLDHLKGEALA